MSAVIRASSWPDLFDCPSRWYAKNIQGLRLPSSGAAALGTAVHAGTGLFDSAKAQGEAPSMEAAIDASVDAVRNPQQEVAWDDDLPPGKAIDIAATLTQGYIATVGAHRTYAAVEVPCDALEIETQHGPVTITGTTDRVRREADGSLGITDLKTGGQAVGADGRAVTKGHHLQLGIYQIMAEQALQAPMTAPAEIVGLKTKGKAAVGTGTIEDVKTPLIGDELHPGLIEMAAQMLKTGLFPPNPKSLLCSEKYCPAHPTCPYHA